MVSMSSTGGGGGGQPPLPDPVATSHPMDPPEIFLVEIVGGQEPRYPLVTFRKGDAFRLANHFNGLVNMDESLAVVHTCNIPPLVGSVIGSQTHAPPSTTPVDNMAELEGLLDSFGPAQEKAAADVRKMMQVLYDGAIGVAALGLGKRGLFLAHGLRSIADTIEAYFANLE